MACVRRWWNPAAVHRRDVPDSFLTPPAVVPLVSSTAFARADTRELAERQEARHSDEEQRKRAWFRCRYTTVVVIPPPLTIVSPPGAPATVRPPLKPFVPLPSDPPSVSLLVQAVEMVLSSNVTAPVDAKSLPQLSVAPVFAVMLAVARIFPSNDVPVPRVAEQPTSQYTPSPEPEGSKTFTTELLAVVSELPIKENLKKHWRYRRD